MRHFLTIAFVLTASLVAVSPSARAAEEELHPKQIVWPFDGVRGKLDKESAQRGFQVYKEVCAACHSLKRVAYRSLSDLGFTEPEIKALAAEKKVIDGVDESGDPRERDGRPSDHFVPPFANDEAARASNGGALPPDLSLMTKARHDGPNYVYSLLTGYAEAPSEMTMNAGMNYNPYFPGMQVAMPAPLTTDGQVEYGDGTKATVDQMARDVVVFLQWAAEPETEARHRMGVKALIFLGLLSIFFWIAKRRIWSRIH